MGSIENTQLYDMGIGCQVRMFLEYPDKMVFAQKDRIRNIFDRYIFDEMLFYEFNCPGNYLGDIIVGCTVLGNKFAKNNMDMG
jgi:hypothetical protein